MSVRVVLLLPLLGMLSCSGGPSALEPPNLDPEAAAQGALELYDKDSDGLLSSEEFESCPGMKRMLKRYDQDGDGSISQEEIQQRLQAYVNSQAALILLSAKVRLNNQPLQGATVRFIPESYLEPAIRPASGKTGVSGAARMAVAAEDLPADQQKIRGIQIGTYRVEITHPEIDIPANYNTQTTLGFEPVFGQPNVEFSIRTRGKKK